MFWKVSGGGLQTARPRGYKLHLRFGTVRGAGTLALAFVLGKLLLAAATLPLARVQPFAGVLFDRLLVVGIFGQHAGRYHRGSRLQWQRSTCGCAPHQAGEGSSDR